MDSYTEPSWRRATSCWDPELPCELRWRHYIVSRPIFQSTSPSQVAVHSHSIAMTGTSAHLALRSAFLAFLVHTI